MKLKQDFVTNSSSTSYLIAVPKDFNPENYFRIGEHMLMWSDIVDDYIIADYLEKKDNQKKTKQDAMKYYLDLIREAFNLTTNKVEKIYQSDDNDKYRITELFSRQVGLLLESWEVGSYDGIVVLVPEEAVLNLFRKVKK